MSKKSGQTQVAAAALVMQGDQILLLRRISKVGNGEWAIPGGKIDFTEDPADACIRELHEETNLTAKDITLIGYTNYVSSSRDTHFVTLRYVCKDFTGQLQNLEPNKSSEIGWFSINDLPHPMFKPTEEFLSSINFKELQ